MDKKEEVVIVDGKPVTVSTKEVEVIKLRRKKKIS